MELRWNQKCVNDICSVDVKWQEKKIQKKTIKNNKKLKMKLTWNKLWVFILDFNGKFEKIIWSWAKLHHGMPLRLLLSTIVPDLVLTYERALTYLSKLKKNRLGRRYKSNKTISIKMATNLMFNLSPFLRPLFLKLKSSLFYFKLRNANKIIKMNPLCRDYWLNLVYSTCHIVGILNCANCIASVFDWKKGR